MKNFRIELKAIKKIWAKIEFLRQEWHEFDEILEV
jgi:hypothetical protein